MCEKEISILTFTNPVMVITVEICHECPYYSFNRKYTGKYKKLNKETGSEQ
jgi:hypothetical protein